MFASYQQSILFSNQKSTCSALAAISSNHPSNFPPALRKNEDTHQTCTGSALPYLYARVYAHCERRLFQSRNRQRHLILNAAACTGPDSSGIRRAKPTRKSLTKPKVVCRRKQFSNAVAFMCATSFYGGWKKVASGF